MRIYKYECRPPIENAALIDQQLRLGYTYRRVLTLSERDRREAIDQLYREKLPAEWARFDAADKRAEEAARALSLSRSKTDMLEPDEEMKKEEAETRQQLKDALKAARKEQDEAREAWKAARKALTPSLKEHFVLIDEASKARAKLAYMNAGNVGLAWGTKLRIAEDVERAGKAAIKVGSLPHIPRFDGGGVIAVQLQGDWLKKEQLPPHAPSPEELKARTLEKKKQKVTEYWWEPRASDLATDTRCRIEYVTPAEWQRLQGRSHEFGRGELVKNGPRAGLPRLPLPQPDPASNRQSKRYRKHAIVRLRIGSDENRNPVWGAWPVILTREIPEVPIKWAHMRCIKVGNRTHWQLELVINDESLLPAKQPMDAGKSLAVNLGWHETDHGIRVAFAVGSDGHEEEVLVPQDFISRVEKLDSIRSIRDRMFDTAKKIIGDWREEGPRPEWFMEATRYHDQWHSQKRLARVMQEWKDKRFDGDENAFEMLWAWYKKDRHLRYWECDGRVKATRYRQQIFRDIAARWTREYAHIYVGEIDLREFARYADVTEGTKNKDAKSRKQRTLAAPSVLRDALRNSSATRGATFDEIASAFKTQTCNACGLMQVFDAKYEREHRCECGVKWDQDANFCRNLLASARRLLANPESTPEPTKKKTGRWQERRKMKEQVQEPA